MLLFECLESRRLLSGAFRFAVIGDYGEANKAEADVARLVRSARPEVVITVGDNFYSRQDGGNGTTFDEAVGRYYHAFMGNYNGDYGEGTADGRNRFFPSLGNHDWSDGLQEYKDYFTLPGNERYYTFRRGPVQFFALSSDPNEPSLEYRDGRTSTAASTQGHWLKRELARSTAPWKIVYMHHAPFSSGRSHGSSKWMQWPFREWGADAVIAGHDHHYERIMRDGIPYFVNGSGGSTTRRGFAAKAALGSRVRSAQSFGAMVVDATDRSIRFRFITREGHRLDQQILSRAPARASRSASPGSEVAEPQRAQAALPALGLARRKETTPLASDLDDLLA